MEKEPTVCWSITLTISHKEGSTAGRSGKRVVVGRTGVEVLDVEANFFFKHF